MLLRGVALIICLLTTALFGDLFLLVPLYPILFVSLPLYRYVNDYWASTWFIMVTWILESLFQVKIICTTSGFQNRRNISESVVIISNHPTRLDWMFLWCIGLRKWNLNHYKIVLKSGLKNVPGFGWAMQKFGFLFLKRKWEEDQHHMTTLLQHLREQNYPLQMLIFPEGTDLSLSNQKKNEEFCLKNNLPVFKHLLYPRLRGFQHTMTLLGNSVEAIYDVTIGYPDQIRRSEKDLFAGNAPKEIHFHIQRYSREEIPNTEEGLAEWCVKRWEEKEKLLEKFAQNKKFEGETREEFTIEWTTRFCFFSWMLFVSLILFLLFEYSWARWYCLFAIILEAGISYFGGADLLELKLHAKTHSKENKNL